MSPLMGDIRELSLSKQGEAKQRTYVYEVLFAEGRNGLWVQDILFFHPHVVLPFAQNYRAQGAFILRG